MIHQTELKPEITPGAQTAFWPQQEVNCVWSNLSRTSCQTHALSL